MRHRIRSGPASATFAMLVAAVGAVAVACSSSGGDAASPSPTTYVEEPHGGSGCLCDAPPDPRFLKVDSAELAASGPAPWGGLELRAGTPVTPEERLQAWFGGSPDEQLEGDAAVADPRIPVSTSATLSGPTGGAVYNGEGGVAGATARYPSGFGGIVLGWTRAAEAPLTVQVGDDLIGVRQELGAYRVRVNGTPGVLEEWSSTTARGGSAFYSVVIVWVDDGVVWTVMSAGLRAEEALDVAQSIRPTQTH